mgnify:CR=1 FL=1
MSESKLTPSGRSLIAASSSRAEFSGHGKAKGAAGYNVEYVMRDDCDILMKSGETMSVNAPENGFGDVTIGAIWDNIKVKRSDIFGKIFGLKKPLNVDLDLGCLYELNDGTRGVIQAFGDNYGAYDKPPFIKLSGDERTGDKEGYDEMITINGQLWDKIKRVILYVYIYDGVADWAQVKPEIHIKAPDRTPMIVTLHARYEELNLCAIAGVERVRKGMRITNYTQYFPGHSEMDRAYGFGISWGDGAKRPVASG